MSKTNLILGDCIAAMIEMADDSVDSIVTDPPYELGFMGKSWDATGIAFNVDVWQQALRVLKPGGHLIAFSGSRTYHRMAVAIEDAGFEIRDQIMWVYGSGFPKSHNISKGIDKAAGAEREVVGTRKQRANSENSLVPMNASVDDVENITAPATPAAKQWDGWGTALKPAHEPIILARKPFIGTVANNVLTYGVGGLNIDGARVGYIDENDGGDWERLAGSQSSATIRKNLDGGNGQTFESRVDNGKQSGRWPANFIHDGSDEVVALFLTVKGQVGMTKDVGGHRFIVGDVDAVQKFTKGTTDSGSAARFFYCAKASKRDRNEGLEGFPQIKGGSMNGAETREGKPTNHPIRANHHPTVKPTILMQYLVRLVTPPGGTVLDPFMGSGSTGKACAYEGFNFVGIDMQKDYFEIAKARINAAIKNAKRSGNTNQHNDRISSVLSYTSSNLPSARNSCNASAKPTDQRNLYSGKSSARLFNTPGFRQMELF